MKKTFLFCFLSLMAIGLFAQTKAEIKSAQELLIALGYNPGPTDGAWGVKTEAALKQFQADSKIPESGKLDSVTVSVMQCQMKALITECKALVKKIAFSRSSLSGDIGISAMQDCRTLVLWPSLKKKGKGEIPNLFEVFYPGLTLTISSLVCIPEKGLAINLDGSEGQSVLQIGTFGSNDNNSPYAGQIIDPTVGYIENVPEGVKIFTFEPDSEEMVFKISKEGFRHISGTGMVTTPGNKVYFFPIKD